MNPTPPNHACCMEHIHAMRFCAVMRLSWTMAMEVVLLHGREELEAHPLDRQLRSWVLSCGVELELNFTSHSSSVGLKLQ